MTDDFEIEAGMEALRRQEDERFEAAERQHEYDMERAHGVYDEPDDREYEPHRDDE
jgi:hypothetical protein